MLFVLYIIFLFYKLSNINDIVLFDNKATINANIYNNHWSTLKFDKCIVNGAIMSPIQRIILPNTTQEIMIKALANDTTFINGKCIYNMTYQNDSFDILEIYYHNNILLDLEYYGMSAHNAYNNITNNYARGRVNYLLNNNIN
jgi:hypothetical protein